MAVAFAAALAWTSIMEMSKELVSLANQWKEKGKMYVLCLRRDIWKSWLSFVTAFLFTILKWRESKKKRNKGVLKIDCTNCRMFEQPFFYLFLLIFLPHQEQLQSKQSTKSVWHIERRKNHHKYDKSIFCSDFSRCFALIFFLNISILSVATAILVFPISLRSQIHTIRLLYVFPSRWREKKWLLLEMVFATIFNSLIPWIVYIALNNFTVDEYK